MSSEMDLEEVKAVVRSLLASTAAECTLQRLLSDFYNETGFNMPTFKYSNEKKFLMSLTDTVKVKGKLNEEKVILVKSQKSSHIASLVQRQGKIQRYVKQPCSQNLDPFSDTSSDNRSSSGRVKPNRRKKSVKTRGELSKPNLLCNKNLYKSNDEIRIWEGETNNYRKHKRGNSIVGTDVVLKKNEVAKSDPKIFMANSGNHRFLHSQNSHTISETDSGTVSSSTSSSLSNQIAWIPDNVKDKLKRLISCQTHGIWCCELPDLYDELYNSHLDYKEYGFRSLIEMILLLNDIFRCVRPGNGDWLVFDASKPLSQEEKAIHSMTECKIPPDIEENVRKLLEYNFEKSGKHDIEVGDFLILYFVMYGVKLEFREYGFRNVKDFMSRLCCRGFKIETEDNKLFVKPILEDCTISDNVDLVIKPDDKLFPELFPDDVVRFDEKFTVLDLEECFKVGKMVDVVVADIWSPTQFFVQLKSYEKDFKSLRQNLLKFYNEDKPKYRMPRATLLPGQVCVALNEPENMTYEKFYRSTIIKATKKKVKVHFVDYGMDCKVKFEDVRFLHRSFFDLPAQGFAARLSNISPAFTKTWPLDANERFLDLVSVPRATFLIDSLDLENKIVSGTLFTKVKNVKENVGMVLIKEGMAFPKEYKPNERVCVPEDDLEGSKDENDTSNPSVSLNDNDKKTREGSSEKFSNDDEDGGIAPEPTETEKADNVDSAIDFPPATDAPENKLRLETENRLRLSWTMGKEIEALAFSLLSGDQWIRGLARANFDFGVNYAKALAEKILFYPEMALPQLKSV